MIENVLIVAGSRTIDAYAFVSAEIELFMRNHGLEKDNTAIMSGCAYGVDSLGDQFARSVGMCLVKVPAQWEKYGKRAGYLRNGWMADMATHCLVICENESKGSMCMFKLAEDMNLITELIKYEETLWNQS